MNVTWILFAQSSAEGLQAIFSIDLLNCLSSYESMWVVGVCEREREKERERQRGGRWRTKLADMPPILFIF